MLAAGVPFVLGSNVPATSMDFVGGAAWLISEARGELVRVNGPSAQVDAKIPDLGTGLGRVSQVDNTVLVDISGEIRSVDIADLSWGGGPVSSDDNALVVGDRAAWFVGPDGRVEERDPVTLASRGTLRLGGTPGRAIAAGDTLVVPLDDGTVRVVEGHTETARVDVGQPDDLIHVSSVGRRVVVLNQSLGRVFRLDLAENEVVSKADVELPDGELLVPSELPGGPLWLLARRSGELVRVGPRTGSSSEYPAVTPTADVAGPAVTAKAVYVVDRKAREIAVFDIATKRVRKEPFPDGVTDPGRVELTVEGGYVFVNDAAGAGVVVFGEDGTRHDIDKYETEGVPGDEALPPSPDPGQDEVPTPNPDPGPGDPAPDPEQPLPPGTDPPAPPTQLTAVAGNALASVSWFPGVGTTPASAFHVSYDGARSPIDVPGDTTSVRIDGLRNGQTYRFEVWATNDYGASERVRSDEVEPSDDVPGTPADVTASGGDASATVGWSAADGRGNDIVDYIVTAAPGGRTATVDGRTTTAMVEGLANGTAYTFTVVAVNRLGIQGAASRPSPAVTPYPPPSPLANLRAESGDGRAELVWDASTSRTPVRYTVAANVPIGGQTEWTTTETGWSRTDLANGTPYRFTITPSNDRGNGVAGTANVTPGRVPTLSDVQVVLVTELEFEVTFNFDAGGLPVTECTISVRHYDATIEPYPESVDGNCDAASGTGRARYPVALYWAWHGFDVHVGNERGSVDGTHPDAEPGVRTRPKSMQIRSDTAAFDDGCVGREGHAGEAAYFASAGFGCPSSGAPTGYVPLGRSVLAECWTEGDHVTDDNGDGTNLWIRVQGYGWMPGIYFTTWSSTLTDHLPWESRPCSAPG